MPNLTKTRPAVPGVVIELVAGERVEVQPAEPGMSPITVALEHKSGRHARLRIIAHDHVIGRPKTTEPVG